MSQEHPLLPILGEIKILGEIPIVNYTEFTIASLLNVKRLFYLKLSYYFYGFKDKPHPTPFVCNRRTDEG